MPIRGSCLCGSVRYELAHGPRRITHCHCAQCRKAHGAGFATYAAVAASDFRYVAGAHLVRRYRSSAPVERAFCARCGSNLTFASADAPADLWVTLGSFDRDPGIAPSCHIFVGSKAAWIRIDDDLPQHLGHQPD